MKPVVKETLKLWLFEVATRYGNHSEKMDLKDFVSFCIISLGRLSESFHGKKLDKDVGHVRAL